MIGNFKDDTNLNNSQISKLHKAFVNDSSTNIKLSKSQLHKTRHQKGYLGKLLGPLLQPALLLIKIHLNYQLKVF